MLFSRISNILRPSQILSPKFILTNDVPKCEFYRTSYLFSEPSDGPPKRPMAPYFRFWFNILPELTAKFPSSSHREKITMSKHIWHSMDKDKKKLYTQSYYEDLDKYKMARLQYECQMSKMPKIEEQQSNTMTKKEKKQLKKSRKLSGRPKKPLTAFFLFLKSKQGSLPKKQAMNWIDGVVLEYKNLSEDEKTKFQEEAKKLNEEYKKGISEWEDTLIKKGQTDILYKRSKFKKEIT